MFDLFVLELMFGLKDWDESYLPGKKSSFLVVDLLPNIWIVKKCIALFYFPLYRNGCSSK